MTIYSQHANRGKIQILATYNSDAGVTSSTVTSVDDAAVAAAIVDALNRVSQSASMPVSVRDERSESYARYPSGHLAAVTDQSLRADLLTGKGEHGLWYEYAMLMLHRAFTDLDTATATMPAPVRTAIAAELATEAHGLLVGLHEYEDGPSEEQEDEPARLWDFEDPFVPFDGGMVELSRSMRERIGRLESDLPNSHLAQAAEDLRLLYSVYIAVEGGRASLEEEYLLVSYEHDDTPSNGYYLDIQAPRPGHRHGSPSWAVSISQWVADEYDSDGEMTSAHGEMVLECILAERPTAGELISMLTLAGSGPEQMSAWAKASVGESLAGTAFTVTSRGAD
jgi:hypothetical protein